MSTACSPATIARRSRASAASCGRCVRTSRATTCVASSGTSRRGRVSRTCASSSQSACWSRGSCSTRRPRCRSGPASGARRTSPKVSRSPSAMRRPGAGTGSGRSPSARSRSSSGRARDDVRCSTRFGSCASCRPAGSGTLREALELADRVTKQRCARGRRLGLPRADRLAAAAPAACRPPRGARRRGSRPARAGARRRRRAAARRSGDRAAASCRHRRPQASRAVRRRRRQTSAATLSPSLASAGVRHVALSTEGDWLRPLAGFPAPRAPGAVSFFAPGAARLSARSCRLAVAGYLWLDRRRGERAAAWAAPALLPEHGLPPVAVAPAPARPRCCSLGAALLLVGFARPPARSRVKRQEATVVLVLDVSGSMAAQDSQPTRLARRQGRRARVMSTPFRTATGCRWSRSPITRPSRPSPTHDLTAVRAAIDQGAGRPAGHGARRRSRRRRSNVGRSVKGTQKGKRPPAVIVVLSDGGQTAGRVTPQQAGDAGEADAKIPVSAVVARARRTVSSLQQLKSGFTERIQVPVQPAVLQSIAQASGGRFYQGAASVDVKSDLRRARLARRQQAQDGRGDRRGRGGRHRLHALGRAALRPMVPEVPMRAAPRPIGRRGARRRGGVRAGRRGDERVSRHHSPASACRARGWSCPRTARRSTCSRARAARASSGGLDAQVTSRDVRVDFVGRLGAPVQPGATTTRYALFRAVSTSSRTQLFQPLLGCVPTQGGGGRSTVSARVDARRASRSSFARASS